MSPTDVLQPVPPKTRGVSLERLAGAAFGTEPARANLPGAVVR